jgi:thiol-disulfide isomerase/thioredoxin
MTVRNIEFTDVEKAVSKTSKSAFNCLAPRIGKVYVVSITRDGCPACKRQKPKMERLAKSTAREYENKVVFERIHVQYSPENNEESSRSKDVFGHYFYPTNMILLRTKDRGAIQYYKNASPEMAELKRNIKAAVEVATMIEKAEK